MSTETKPRKPVMIKTPIIVLERLDKAIEKYNKKFPHAEKNRNALVVEKMGEITAELEKKAGGSK